MNRTSRPDKRERKAKVKAPPPLFSEVQDQSRTVFLVGDVEEDLIHRVTEQIVLLSEASATKPITIVVNTFGGDVYETMALYDLVKYVACPIRTVGLGKIMSAGALLIAMGDKGHRLIGRNAMLMYHQGSEGNGGDLWEQKTMLAEFERQEEQFDLLVAKETGKSLDQVRGLYLPKRLDAYLSAEQSVAFGFADAVIG